MTVKTPNYVLKEDVNIYSGPQDKKTLPAGSFVKPIEAQYVPAHVRAKEKLDWNKLEPHTEVYCYTRYGFVIIKRDNLRER